MRQAVMWGAGILLAAGVLSYEPLSSAAVTGAGQAVIDASGGYGITECLTRGEPCGQIVARSWCQSNGYKRLISFREAKPADATHAGGALLVGDDGGDAVVINCGA